jgi:hypothetical protein
MEITIEESVLLEYIEKTSNRGEISHKGIHWLLKDIYRMGCLWNQNHQVIFTNEDQDSQIDEEYQQELLKKAQ